MDISKLTNNPVVKSVLLKQLKGAMIDGNVQLIAITLDEKGDLAFEVYDKYPVAIVDANELQELKTTIQNLLQ